MEAILEKKPPKMTGRWQSRLFRLRDRRLMVFKKEVTEFKTAIDSAAKITLDLTHMISLSIDKKNENVLIIRHPMTDLALRFKSGPLFMCWLKVLSSFTINTASGPKTEASIPSNYAYAIYCILQALYTHPELTRVEGLFRVSAEKQAKQHMFHELLSQTYDVAQLHQHGNIHVLANVLAMLLSNLPSSIFREKQISALITFFDGVTNRSSKQNAMDIFHSNLLNNDDDDPSPSHIDDEVAEIAVSHLQALKNKIDEFYNCSNQHQNRNRYGLMTLIFHLLKQIVLNEDIGKMTAESLSRIFCDILESRIFLMKTKNPMQLFRMKFLVKTLIYHAYTIFPEQEWHITDICYAEKCEIATINLYNEFDKLRHQQKNNQWSKKIRLKKTSNKSNEKRDSHHAAIDTAHTDVGPMRSTKFINHFQNPSDFDVESALETQQPQQRSSEKLHISSRSDANRMPPQSLLALQTVQSTDSINAKHHTHYHQNKVRKSANKVSFKLTPMVSAPPPPSSESQQRASCPRMHMSAHASSLVPYASSDSREPSMSATNDQESEDSSLGPLPPNVQQSISYAVALRPSIITRPLSMTNNNNNTAAAVMESRTATVTADDIDDEKETGDAHHDIYGVETQSGKHKYRKMLQDRQRSRLIKDTLDHHHHPHHHHYGRDDDDDDDSGDMELVIFDDHENIPAPHADEELAAHRHHPQLHVQAHHHHHHANEVQAKTPTMAMTSTAYTRKAHLETMAALTAFRRRRSASQPREYHTNSGDMDAVLQEAEEKALEEAAYQIMQEDDNENGGGGGVSPVNVDEFVSAADIRGFKRTGRQQSDGTVLAKKQKQKQMQKHREQQQQQLHEPQRLTLKQHKPAYSSHYHGSADILKSEKRNIDPPQQPRTHPQHDEQLEKHANQNKSASHSSINYDALIEEAAAMSDEEDEPQVNTNNTKDLERVTSPTSEWLEDVYNEIVNDGIDM